MKKQPITLTVPKPCHEKWQEMTPAEQGRFCLSCQKTVHDFTTKTDREVARYFEHQLDSTASGSTCGRFRSDQLQRPLHVERPDGWGARLRTLGLVLPGLLIGSWVNAQNKPQLKGKVACASSTPPDSIIVENRPIIMGLMVMPQPAPESEVPVSPPPPPPIEITVGDTILIKNGIYKITGKIMEADNGEPLIGASILVKGTQSGTISDIDGSYELSLPTSIESPVLEVSYTGFKPAEVLIKKGQAVVDIKLEPGAMQGEIVCYAGVVAVRHDQTLYKLAKQKIVKLFRSLRKQRETKPKDKELLDYVEETVQTSLPEPDQPELPHPAEPSAMPVEAFPNPFSRNLSIRFDSPNTERLTIRLTDMQGQTVLLQTYEAIKGRQEVALDGLGTASLTAGKYLLELSNSKSLLYAGLVVKD
ncbi:MAG: T9SS type A sorting domain-containing protein [Bacteroidetes bacterium]|nr:T9SS type A sorting domain-containing protein [Bacteroidota bacterium]